ncbi:MAG: SMC-Scp complex subunit ScpB [Candidatus Micrarchaeota archaeon]|nr:SMC-Scp complex subunit ScpB [Candidatus Micrarchaeota archaeon]MDE1864174.1 SMC-Scp complex subunit ScpB [Candidatus Micrarchaeota archaeon]
MDEQIDSKKLVEAALFMSQNALGINELVSATGIMSPGHIQASLKELIEEYKARDTALQLIEVAGKYMFALKEPYATKVSGLAVGPDLSRGALRLLAYVGKNESVLQSSLVKIFGSATYDYMKELAEKEFVESKKSGRSRRISTTVKFKEYFNV